MIVRDAGPADAMAIADLHARSWRDAYRGMLPDSLLDSGLDAAMEAYWTPALAAPPPGFLALVAETPDGLVGLLGSFPNPARPGGVYLDNLHVDPAVRGGGIGRRLLGAALARWREGAATGIALSVLAANRRALDFYRRLGARLGTAVEKPAMGHPVLQVPVRWNSLDDVAL